MNNGVIVNYFVKKILKLKKTSASLHRSLEIIKIQLILSNYYNFEILTLEEYKSLKYFLNKI